MKKHLVLFITLISASLFVSCSEDEFTPANYVTFETSDDVNVGVEIGGTSTHEVSVYTTNVTGNDRTFDLMVGEGTTLSTEGYSLPASVTVPGGTNEGSFTVEVSDMNLGLTGKELVVGIAEDDADLYTGEPYSLMVVRTCEGTEFVIDFAFDDYASEISWSLADADGDVVVTGGDYADGTATASRSLCLDQGTYTFEVEDSYGDGIVDGSVTLSYAGEELTVVPGDFGPGESINFTLESGGGSTVNEEDTDGETTDGGETTEDEA